MRLQSTHKLQLYDLPDTSITFTAKATQAKGKDIHKSVCFDDRQAMLGYLEVLFTDCDNIASYFEAIIGHWFQ